MTDVLNPTPLPLGFFVATTPAGAPRLVFVVKATLAYAPGGSTHLLDRGAQRQLSGDVPEESEARTYASDFAPYKPAAEALVVGAAPPGKQRVSLRVGALHRQAPSNALGPRPLPAPDAVKGTFDEKWAEERWPYLPIDFDWTYFHAAPEEQRVRDVRGNKPAYFEGDEAILLEGLDPDQPDLSLSLPGLKPRCLAHRADGGLEEVPLLLDTVWVDCGERQLVLLWRGSVSVATRHAEDVGAVSLVLEKVGEPPRSIDEVAAEAARQEAPPPVVADASDAPELVADIPSDASAAPSAAEEEQALLDVSRKLLREGGAPAALTAKADAVSTTAELVALLDAEHAHVDTASMEEATAQARADSAKKLREDGFPLDGQTGAVGPNGEPIEMPSMPPPPKPAPRGERLQREEIASRLRDGSPLVGMDASGEDLSDLDFTDVDLTEANLTGARLTGTVFNGATLSRAVLAKVSAPARADGASAPPTFVRAALDEAVLDDAQLSGAVLDEADLSKARATRSKLGGASFERARLGGAVLDEANLEQAKLSRATLAGASLTGAMAIGVVFSDADMTGARLVGADLTGADLARAQLHDAVLDRAMLSSARAARASFRGAQLVDVQAIGIDLEEADLSRSTLDDAVLDEARLEAASLEHARGRKVSMKKARATGLRASQSSFVELDLTDASAAGAVWIGADLTRARFDRADLTRAFFGRALLPKASFHLAVLKTADFTRANLAGAVLTKVNLMRGILEGADLSHADVRGSNLFESELWEATTTDARFERTNLKRTKLSSRA